MNVPQDRIFIRNDNFKIPNTDSLFIALGMVDSQIMSVSSNTKCVNDELVEQQSTVMREAIQIDLLSRNNDALTRRAEVFNALASVYARQKQDEEEFTIFRIPRSFVNNSRQEQGAMLHRYTIVINVHSWYINEKVIATPSGDWYKEFSTSFHGDDLPEVDFEFTIDKEST